MSKLKPLDHARALVILARLILLARRRAALHGVQPAHAAARRLVPLGQALAAAVEAAEEAIPGVEQKRALVEVARLGETLEAEIEQWEGIRLVIAEAIDGVREERPRRPGER